MKNLLVVLILFITLNSCISYQTSDYNTYLGTSIEDMPIQVSPEKKSEFLMYIPAGMQYVAEKVNYKKDYWKIKYDETTGYVKKPVFGKLYKISYTDKLVFNDSIGYHIKNQPTEISNYYSGSTINNTYSGGGSVHVKGYYRKDGTYVKSHTRSAPKSRSYGGRRR